MSDSLTLRDVSSLGRLEAAWHVVYRNDAEDGQLSNGVRSFAENTRERLEQLSDELRTGRYEPSPLIRVAIPKASGQKRILHIPAVRDRIVERCVADLVALRLDRWFSPWSFAYRSGYGIRDATACLVRMREHGSRVVIRCDVNDCFDSLDRSVLLESLERRLRSPEITQLVNQLLERSRLDGKSLKRSARGAPQGGPLSTRPSVSLTVESYTYRRRGRLFEQRRARSLCQEDDKTF